MKLPACLSLLASPARWAALALLAALIGCAAMRQDTAAPAAVAAPAVPAEPAAAAASNPPAGAPAAPAVVASVAGESPRFATQSASYTANGYEGLPGWGGDNLVEAWPVFLDSCRVLSGRGAEWRTLCDRARQLKNPGNDAIRGFFEREFAAYQIRGDDQRSDGVVTGYYEPEMPGSRRYGAPFIYPVYAEPSDMLFLDTRKIVAAQRGQVVAARVDGRNVLVQAGLSTRDLNASGLYVLDLSAVTPDAVDRKARLRIEGRTLLPYYTREEIETRGVPNARVIAFVGSAAGLYEMQIQGSGRIRLREGGLIRLSYSEQNGHVFRPALVASAAPAGPRIRSRGAAVAAEADTAVGDDVMAGDDHTTIRTRGFKLVRPVAAGAVAVPGRAMAGKLEGSGISDPSYVFFRETTGHTGGPLGTLGLPLAPGRSIAVDPRSTPLGYPVFVSTRNPENGVPMRRLTIAQDTGGSVRGAVRADYFFGYGQRAAVQARRMKERGEMWVLLPRGLKVAIGAASPAVRTRGGPSMLPACLVASEDQCVDESTGGPD